MKMKKKEREEEKPGPISIRTEADALEHSIISSLDAHIGPLFIFWGRDQLTWLNQICPNKDVHAGHRVAGFGVTNSSLHWTHCFSLWSQTMLVGGWREDKMASLFLLIPVEGSLWPPLLRKPSQKSELFFCVPVFHQISAFKLPEPHCQHTLCHSSPVFHLWLTAGIQNHKS